MYCERALADDWASELGNAAVGSSWLGVSCVLNSQDMSGTAARYYIHE